MISWIFFLKSPLPLGMRLSPRTLVSLCSISSVSQKSRYILTLSESSLDPPKMVLLFQELYTLEVGGSDHIHPDRFLFLSKSQCMSGQTRISASAIKQTAEAVVWVCRWHLVFSRAFRQIPIPVEVLPLLFMAQNSRESFQFRMPIVVCILTSENRCLKRAHVFKKKTTKND